MGFFSCVADLWDAGRSFLIPKEPNPVILSERSVSEAWDFGGVETGFEGEAPDFA